MKAHTKTHHIEYQNTGHRETISKVFREKEQVAYKDQKSEQH